MGAVMAEQSARAYWTTGKEQGELRSERIAKPLPGQALVATLHSGISRGTELLVHRGRVPVSEYQRMRAPHQDGGFPWPIKYGYANVGRVLEGRAELVGREVFCLYPHQTAYVVDESALVLLPASVPAARAVLAANMETALNAVWDAELKAGDRVAVVGGGTLGLLVAYLAARYPGTSVQLVEIDPHKAELARVLGADFALAKDARGHADVVIHASGSPAGLSTALGLAGTEAIVLELSWYGEQSVSLALGESFHALRLRIQSSQVGTLPAVQRARWNHRRRLELALCLLADERLDRLIEVAGDFESLPQIMRRLASGELSAPCYRIDYRGEQ
jgi:NADPH:quinone reductase-like Zn-dependent oxidoreductase